MAPHISITVIDINDAPNIHSNCDKKGNGLRRKGLTDIQPPTPRLRTMSGGGIEEFRDGERLSDSSVRNGYFKRGNGFKREGAIVPTSYLHQKHRE